MSIAENISRVRERMTAAARRAGRDPQSITLMAVTKTVSAARIREAYEAGVRRFGENRVQEFAHKAAALRTLPDFRCHMIGHLQSNKASDAVALFDAIDSIDSLRLARRVSAAAQQSGKTVPALIEINIGAEATKSGFVPGSSELDELLRSAPALAMQVRGLMTIPPYSDDPEESRPYFKKMAELFRNLAGQHLEGIQLDVLSMGMSHDFEIAIEEGATCIRVGTAIFGDRSRPAHP